MSPIEQRLYDRIRRRAATLQPDLSRRLLASYDLIRGALTEAELTEAISSGSVDAMIARLMDENTLDHSFASLRELLDRRLVDESKAWTRQLPGVAAPALFDILNPHVLDAIRQLDTRVIQGLKEEVRETVRTVATIGLDAGKHPRAVARGIRQLIGVAPNQAGFIANLRIELEEGRFADAASRVLIDKRFKLESMATLSPADRAARIDKIVNAYEKSWIAHNTETHTRTIALDAQRLAQRLSWVNAIDQGFVEESRLRRQWFGVLDDRERPEHVAMEGETVGFNQTYSNGQMIPGETDYNCRCGERIILAAA